MAIYWDESSGQWLDDGTMAVDQVDSGGASGWGWNTTSTTNSAGDIDYSNGITLKNNGDVLVGGQYFGNTGETGSGTMDTSWTGMLGGIFSQLGTGALNAVKGLVTNPKTGAVDLSKIASLGGGLLGGLASNSSWAQPQIQKTGYQGGIPTLTAVREQVPGTYDPNRRAGSSGQQYFTDMKYVSPTDAATAKATAAEEAKAIEAKNKANPARQPVAEYAAGGLAGLAKGSYLAGATDGMADKLSATIDNKQPAKLSHGEFVLPSDIVSHLGNGNSEAGAERLYEMMDKIRKARTGTTKQGKQINPNKFMPG